MKISCLIVDDEPLALDLIERYINNTPFLECKGKCASAVEAMTKLHESPYDLIFLDIQMPELTGLEFAKTIPSNTRIIFTTAFDQYAIEGYKVNALDYLLKPFNYEEFYRSVQRARLWFENNREATRPGYQAVLFVKSEYKQVRIDLRDVIYFEGLKDYIKIWLSSQVRPILTLLSLKSLENELDPTLFMRVHRSFIISLNAIQSVERGRALMSNGIYVTIADQYKTKFQDFISGKTLG